MEKKGINIYFLKLKIVDIILKTLIAVQPNLLHNYRTNLPSDRTFQSCFEILGFDILIDEVGKPWLLEVNQAPSFATDSALDYKVKKQVIMDTFRLLGLSKSNRQKQIEMEARQLEGVVHDPLCQEIELIQMESDIS